MCVCGALLTCCMARLHFRPSSCGKRPKISQNETDISNTKIREHDGSWNDEAPTGKTRAKVREPLDDAANPLRSAPRPTVGHLTSKP